MDLTDRLALIIDAKTDGAVSSIRKLSLEEQAAAERTDVLQAKIADLNTRMARSATGGTALQQKQLAKLNGEYQALTSTLATTASRAGKVEGVLSKVGLSGLVPSSTLGAIGKAAPGLLAGAAAFGGFEFIKSGITDYVNLADAVRKFQQASGASAEDASKLIGISNALGLSTDSLSLGMFRLAKNIALTPTHLTQYGVAIAHTKQGNVDLVRTLENVSTAYQATTDPTKRAALVYEAFGRAGTALLPILNANKDQIQGLVKAEQERGHIFDQQDINNAYQYQIATRELKDSFQALALTASKGLVPALTDAETVLTRILDLSHHVSIGGHSLAGTVVKDAVLGPEVAIAGLFGLGGGHSAAAKAQREQAAQQDQAARDALSQAALGTLAGSTDILAGPQNVKDARKTLNDAKDALTNAVADRAKAIRDLQRAQQGSPAASASQIEAANARVTAAQARLDTALYTGGPGVASARAAVLSAQSSLNKLRQQGGVDTNRLADAEDRLRRAEKAVADQRAAVKQGRKSVRDASGLTASEVLGRIRGQVHDQSREARANITLAARGASTDTIAAIDKLNQQLPGTLVKVAHTLNKGTIAALNAQEDTLALAQEQFASAAANPDVFAAAGRTAGKAYVKSFTQVLTDGLPLGVTAPAPHGTVPSTGRAPSIGGLLGAGLPGINVNGNIVVKGANAHQVAREIARAARHRALSNGEPDPLGVGPGGA